MKLYSLPIFFFLLCMSCVQSDHSDESQHGQIKIDPSTNLLASLSKEKMDSFNWMNEPVTYQFKDQKLLVTALKGTDFFNNPEDNSVSASAPLIYQEISSDFVATTLVKPDFSSMWNACALMVHVDSTHWIKSAFENSDATGKSIVTVVTNGFSDDANGAILSDHDRIWLKLIRKGKLFSMHWSEDNEVYHMARLTKLETRGLVKVGLEAQSPVGPAAEHVFLYFSLEPKTVKDLRKGD